MKELFGLAKLGMLPMKLLKFIGVEVPVGSPETKDAKEGGLLKGSQATPDEEPGTAG